MNEIKPMLCKVADKNLISFYEQINYLASKKYDGTRAIAIIQDKKVILKGRSGYTYENKFPEIVAELINTFPDGTIIDGELCCNTFQQTQSRCLTKDGYKSLELVEKYPAKYFIFDIIADGYNNIADSSLTERLKILGGYLDITDANIVDCRASKRLIFVEHTSKIKELWEKAKKEDWEGIVIKNQNSAYSFKRSSDWLKLKCVKRRVIEFIEYSLNNAGVRAVSKEGIVCQIAGEQSRKFIELHNKNQSVKVEVEYLEQFENGNLRQPVCKEVIE